VVADAAEEGVVHRRVGAVEAAAVAVVMIGRPAKIILLKKGVIARNRGAVKTRIFASVKMVRVMKMRTYPLRWMNRPKAKALWKQRRMSGMRRMNFTKNALKPTASIPRIANVRVMIEGAMTGDADVSVIAEGLTGAGAIGIGIEEDVAMSGSVLATAFYAARSIEFGTAWKQSYATWNAWWVRCNKRSRSAI